jgi:Cu(I)/Ag(I) efflux system membrane protein CusA/SilA
VVEAARDRLLAAVEQGRLTVPPGIIWEFAGNYQNQLRSERRLRMVLPLSFFLISLILYIQFRSTGTTLMVFTGIVVAWAGGFLMIWLYGQGWFLDFPVFGRNLRDVFQMGPLNLSVAIWVGFIALFGIATDDGVVMATYLDQVFQDAKPSSVAEIRQLVLQGAMRRVLPCLMTSATTILALLPVLSATGRGADIMVPMAIPCFGGMCVELMTMFVVPVLYCYREERRFRRSR